MRVSSRFRHAATSLAQSNSRGGIESVVAAHESTAAGGPGMDDAEQRSARLLVQLYNSWEMADPGKGHAAQRELWNARLDSESSKVNGTNERR